MKVRIKRTVPDHEGKSLKPGTVIEVAVAIARPWIALGKAVPAEGENSSPDETDRSVGLTTKSGEALIKRGSGRASRK